MHIIPRYTKTKTKICNNCSNWFGGCSITGVDTLSENHCQEAEERQEWELMPLPRLGSPTHPTGYGEAVKSCLFHTTSLESL